jgi:hypothetical protein
MLPVSEYENLPKWTCHDGEGTIFFVIETERGGPLGVPNDERLVEARLLPCTDSAGNPLPLP